MTTTMKMLGSAGWCSMEGDESCHPAVPRDDVELRRRKQQRTTLRNGYCKGPNQPNDENDLMPPHYPQRTTDETSAGSSTSYADKQPDVGTTDDERPGSAGSDGISDGRTCGSTSPVLSGSPAKSEVVILEFTFKPLIIFTLLAPLSAMMITFAIGFSTDYTQLLNYEWTCGKVLLPSFSRIVNLPKERIFWNFLVLSHVLTRPVLVYLNYRICREPAETMRYPRAHLFAARSIVVIGMLEVFSIPWLTTIGEREEPEYHVYFFTLFGVSSLFYFLLTSLMFGVSRHYASCEKAVLSYRLKLTFAVSYLILLPSVFTFFLLYWQLCFNFAYDFFAAFEYLTILVNFGFHMTSILDCNDVYQIRVPTTGRL